MLWAAFMLFLFSGIDVKWTFWDMTWRLGLFALGLGIGLAPLTNAATSTVPIEEVGVASSVLALARNLAGAFGVAIFATILSDSTTNSLIAIQQHTIINTSDPTILKVIPPLMIVKANIQAFGTVFRTASIFMLVGAVAALFIKEAKHDTGLGKEHNGPIEM